MISQAGAGPPPFVVPTLPPPPRKLNYLGPRINHRDLTIENLTSALNFLGLRSTQLAAQKLGETIRDEDGVKGTVEAFYRHLPLLNMRYVSHRICFLSEMLIRNCRCDLDPSQVAVFWSDAEFLRLSAFAAQTLIDAKKIDPKSLRPHRTYIDFLLLVHF